MRKLALWEKCFVAVFAVTFFATTLGVAAYAGWKIHTAINGDWLSKLTCACVGGFFVLTCAFFVWGTIFKHLLEIITGFFWGALVGALLGGIAGLMRHGASDWQQVGMMILFGTLSGVLLGVVGQLAAANNEQGKAANKQRQIKASETE